MSIGCGHSPFANCEYRPCAGPGEPWVGALALFSGRIGTVEGGRHAKSLQVRSDTELLDALAPRHVYRVPAGLPEHRV
jgi:hypothetical protein